MSCCPRVACGGGGCCSGCGREETSLEGFMMTGTMTGSELEEIVLCMSGEGVHGEVGMYVCTQLAKISASNTDIIQKLIDIRKRKYAYCTLETMDKRKVVCVSYVLQETHN